VSDAPEELPGTGDQMRWRDVDSGESDGGFEDLLDDGPRLGALSGQRDPYEDDDAFEDYFSGSVDEEDDPLAAFGGMDAPFDEPTVRSAPRPRRRERSPEGGRGDRGHDVDRPTGGSDTGDRNLPVAVAVGVGLVALGLLCFKLGTLPTALLATAVVTLAGAEYFKALRTAGYNPAALLGMVVIGGFVLSPALFGLAAYPLLIGITVVAALVWYLLVAPGEGSVPNLAMTLLGVFWIGGLGSFSGLFLGLGDVVADRGGLDTNPGIGVLLAAVIASVSYDVGGYFVGRRFGRTRLSAASPNKTQEGFGGGIAVSVIVTTAVVSFISPIGDDTFFRTLVFALLCGLAAPIGDLCESFVKRDLGVKDMGTVLPGHGGVLDRFDSLLFVLPVAYFVSIPLGIWTV
jgi:phosphatidate cytidylyltransferase